jgi:hypothetical protein
MSAANCPWCLAFKLFDLSGSSSGRVHLPLAVLPSELCDDCRGMRRRLQRAVAERSEGEAL